MRSSIKQQSALVTPNVRGDEQRQTMVRTTSSLPRKHLHPSTLQQPRPLCLNVIRISRQAICDIVDYDEDFKAINGLEISHGSICSHLLREKLRCFNNPHITESL